MTEKRVIVRLAAVGGRQVRAELEGVGDAGSRGFDLTNYPVNGPAYQRAKRIIDQIDPL